MKKEILEELTDYPEKCELDYSLTEDAKQLAQELYGNKKRAKRKALKSVVAVACPLVAVLAIALPLYFSLNREDVPQIVYNDEILTEFEMEDIDGFLDSNGYSALHYKGENVYSFLYKFTDSNEDAYVKQTLMTFTESSFDIVDLYICVSGKQFYSFEGYKNMEITGSCEISEIKANYNTTLNGGSYVHYVMFETPTMEYYMKIETSSAEGVVENYLQMLIEE